MGIYCEINLFKPSGDAFIPGEIVSGIIKYAVDKETLITETTVSLKGNGYLRVRDHIKKRKNRRSVFTHREEYVNCDQILQRDLKGAVLPPGQYQTNFYFQLPSDIPKSFKYENIYSSYSIRCQISYYIRIKFKKPGMFKLNRHFKKEITVVSGLKPRLPISPTVFSEQKKLFKLFSNKPNIVNIKANIESCIILPGGRIELNYELFNDSSIIVKSVETKLKEVHTFKPKAHNDIKISNYVPETETKTPQIDSGETQSMLIVIDVPTDNTSIENSKIMSRDYFVKITAYLPAPHFNASLEIPVQIGDVNCIAPIYPGPPPTYWETMGEQVDDDDSQIA